MSTEDLHGSPVPPAPPTASAPAASVGPAGGPAGSGSGGRGAVVIVTAVIGGLALLGTGGTAAVAAVNDLSRADDVRSIAVDGVTSIDLEADASDVTVRFGDVDEAMLTVTGSRGGWSLERDEEELVVRSPRAPFGWWLGGNWFDDDTERVLLTLPNSLKSERVDADFTLSAGSLDVSGDFGDLDVTVNAGDFQIEGSARELGAHMNAGSAELELDGVREADLGVTAGDLYVTLTGEAPDDVEIDVNAGSLELTVPDVEYLVVPEVTAGELDDRVARSSSSRHVIDVSIAAGDVTLLPED